MRRLPLGLSLLPLALVLAGCKLIDQTTFAPDLQVPGAAELAALPPVAGRVPLLAIRYTTPDPDYAEPLRSAVAAVERRRPGSFFDVVAVIPAIADPARFSRALAQGSQDAASVMRAMLTLGVPETRIRLGAAIEAATAVREVRVYIR